MFQIICALNFIHGNCIIHRDIKPLNILIDSDGKVRITDFGLSRIMINDEPLNQSSSSSSSSSSSLSINIGTKIYLAPELLLKSVRYDFSVDIWSLGFILMT